MMKLPMTSAVRKKFSSQAAPEALAALRQIAESQGRQFQVVLAEMMRTFEYGTFDIAHVDPWLRGFASAEGE
jgi:hypothetical protein